MSRTTKSAKPIGYEYWSRRPFNKYGGIIGWFTKRRTAKAERAAQVDMIRKIYASDAFTLAEAHRLFAGVRRDEPSGTH